MTLIRGSKNYMANLLKMVSVVGVATLLGMSPIYAQDATTTDTTTDETQAGDPNPSDGLSLGENVTDENAIGTTYTKETIGDWDIRCVRSEDGNDPCQLYQLLVNGEGNSVAEISMFALPAGQKAVAGATVAVPLETLLTQQLTLAIDGGQARRYPFTWCSTIGCFARIGFTAPDIAAFKRGASATVTIVPVVAPENKVNLTVSLTGFTAGFEAVNAANK